MSLPLCPLALEGPLGRHVSMYAIAYRDVASFDALWMLSADEQRRAARLVSAEDAARFRIRRAMTRVVLGEHLGRSPDSIEFASVGTGKPVLQPSPGDGRQVFFNVSTTHACSVIAVAASPVGVDIEQVRTGVWAESMAARVLTPEEIAWVREHADRDRAFVECWVRKESLGKCVGSGLDLAVSQTIVTPQCSLPGLGIQVTEPWRGTLLGVAVERAVPSAD